MSGFNAGSPRNSERIESMPESLDLRLGEVCAPLQLPGLEKAISSELVSSTEDLRRQLKLALNLDPRTEKRAMLEAAWRFARTAASEKARDLGVKLCKELDPDGIFTHTDFEHHLAKLLGPNKSLQARVYHLFDRFADKDTVSMRALALEQLEDILGGQVTSDNKRTAAALGALIYGQGELNRSFPEYQDRIELLICQTTREDLKEALVELRRREINQNMDSDQPHIQMRRPSSIGSALVGMGLLETLANDAGLANLLPHSADCSPSNKNSVESKIKITGAIESQSQSNPKVVERCRELRARFVSDWLMAGEIRFIAELKQLMFPCDSPLLVHPTERLARVEDLIQRTETYAVARMGMYLREEILPKEHPRFSLKFPGNIETILFTDNQGRWNTELTPKRKMELIRCFINEQSEPFTRTLGRQLQLQLIDVYQSGFAPEKQALAEVVLGAEAKYIPFNQARQALGYIGSNSNNANVKRMCNQLSEDLDREEKTVLGNLRRSLLVRAIHRWLNRD